MKILGESYKCKIKNIEQFASFFDTVTFSNTLTFLLNLNELFTF